MTEKIILILIGVISYTLGQYILKFYIEKYNDYIKTKIKIVNIIRLKANKITNFNIDESLSLELRELSCELNSNYYILPYPIKIFKKNKKIEIIINGLMGLSNSRGKEDSKFIKKMYFNIENNINNL